MYLLKMLSPLLLICFAQKASAQKQAHVTAKDLQPLIGCFEGKLTYLDYTTGKPFTMPANLVNRQADPLLFVFANIYPDEPKANSSDSIRLSADGHMLNDEKIISKRKIAGGIEIITQATGTDGNDNKAATFRFTYRVGREFYSNIKEVKFNGDTVWLKRHEYNSQAKSCR